MTINWDDPAARAALIEAVDGDEYNRRFAEYQKASTVVTINGHDIRTVGSRFGRLFMVGKTGRAFLTLDEAKHHAQWHAPDTPRKIT